jgi:16S rRNA (cytidine1402-2'-O)-methyltransferase
VLQDAAIVLAEDTRRAGALFARLGIEARRFMSFHEHNEQARLGQVLDALADGAHVALISDAGTPLVSDPGYRLVAACREAGVEVTPVPGPSAVTAALSAAGLPPHPFCFLGFAPRKAGQLRCLFERYGPLDCTLVLFDRKNRLPETLKMAHEVLGSRRFCLARELTKEHEEFILGRLNEWEEKSRDLLGEVTLVVAAPDEAQATDKTEVDAVAAEERDKGGSPKEIARRVKARTRGWSVKEIYARLERD